MSGTGRKAKRRSPSAGRLRLGRFGGRRFRADAAREARSLGLTTDEYLRLLVALSKSLRQGLLKNRRVDAKALLELAESPVFGAMIQYVAQSAGSLAKTADDATGDTAETESTDNRETSRPQPDRAPSQNGSQPGQGSLSGPQQWPPPWYGPAPGTTPYGRPAWQQPMPGPPQQPPFPQQAPQPSNGAARRVPPPASWTWG